MLKNILLATDFSAASRSALRAAITLCKDAGSMLHVVHVLPKMEGRVYKIMTHVAEKDMEAFFPSDLYANNRKEILYFDSPCEAILHYAKDYGCDLIVLGTKSKTTIGELIGSNLIWKLKRETTHPLMLVRETGHPEQPEHHVTKILAAVHISRLSKKAFVFAVEAAKILAADLHAVCVIDPQEVANEEGLESLRKVTQMKLQKLVSAEAAKRDFSLSRLSIHTLSGNPPEEITKYVGHHGIDLIVIGAHPARGILDVFTPNLAFTVLSNIETPEIVISDGAYGKHGH